MSSTPTSHQASNNAAATTDSDDANSAAPGPSSGSVQRGELDSLEPAAASWDGGKKKKKRKRKKAQKQVQETEQGQLSHSIMAVTTSSAAVSLCLADGVLVPSTHGAQRCILASGNPSSAIRGFRCVLCYRSFLSVIHNQSGSYSAPMPAPLHHTFWKRVALCIDLA